MYNQTEILIIFISLYVLSVRVCGYDMTEYRIIPDVIFRKHDEVIENTSIFACVKACMRSLPCLSFAFDKSSQSCYLYNRILFNGEGETVDNQIGSNTYTRNTGMNNIALGQQTNQDSTAYQAYSSLAVDGNKRTISHTVRLDRNSWWCVGLKSYYDIDRIVIWNLDKYQYRLAHFKLHVSDKTPCSGENLQSATLCYVNDGSSKQVYTVVECNQPSVSLKNVQSLYITLQTSYLHMAEVEIQSDDSC